MEPTSRQTPRRATIEDVAAAAHVSVATVSRALRGLPNVAPSTRARVGEAATGLNYQPDPAASRLAAGATTTLLVMVPGTSSWYFAQVIAGAEAVAAETSHDFLVIGVRSLEQRDRLLDEGYRLERRADGVLMVNIGATDEQARSLQRRGVGLATIGTRAPGCPVVQVDDEAVGRLAAEHLVGLGHRRIGVIGGSLDDPLSFDVPALRRRGFAAGLAARGLEFDPDLHVAGNFSVDGGREAMARLLDARESPSAVFAMSDEMAFGGMMELSERALRPGVDISVMGVDDHEFARVVSLTSIRQQVELQGALAIRALLEAIAGLRGGQAPATDEPIRSPIDLVIRSSTGAGPFRSVG